MPWEMFSVVAAWMGGFLSGLAAFAFTGYFYRTYVKALMAEFFTHEVHDEAVDEES